MDSRAMEGGNHTKVVERTFPQKGPAAVESEKRFA
jgi:hypothetical protein